MAPRPQLLGPNGQPLGMSARPSIPIRRGPNDIRARFDAAQTAVSNENHWANADYLDPLSAASYNTRRILRSRSRYEIIENNAFLKGVILMVCNDFVGSGPKLQVTDQRLSPERREIIQGRFQSWCKVIKFRQKLWRARMAKIVDGEGFLIPYAAEHRDPVKLNVQVVETDRITSPIQSPSEDGVNELDGVKFDNYYEPTAYYVYDSYPGTYALYSRAQTGRWVKADKVAHWYRQDRGWLRGIPELTPSLAQCAILRRYTLAVLRHAETAADLTAILETQGPANLNPWTDASGQQMLEDDPFSIFPIEMGMITTLPWGYSMKQLEAVPFGVQYDSYVGSCLREILRPIQVPFNYAIASSKDSNMASAVVDTSIYRKGQEAERYDCEEDCLGQIFEWWWKEAVLIDGYLGDSDLSGDPEFRDFAPMHKWRWDEVALLHTDPTKVANYLAIMHDKGFFTDKDVQEKWLNRPVEEWADEIMQQQEVREEIGPISVEEKQAAVMQQTADQAVEIAKMKPKPSPSGGDD